MRLPRQSGTSHNEENGTFGNDCECAGHCVHPEQLFTWQEQFFASISEVGNNQSHAQKIYAESILNAKLSSLKTTFPAIIQLISEAAFESIAGGYLHDMVKTPVDIGQLGQGFSEYLIQHDVTEHVPYIAELAKFEWQWHQAFNAPEPEKKIPSSSGLNGGSRSLVGDPPFEPEDDLEIFDIDHVFIETYQYPVDEIWACCQPEYVGDFDVDLSLSQCITMLLYRKGLCVKMQRI